MFLEYKHIIQWCGCFCGYFCIWFNDFMVAGKTLQTGFTNPFSSNNF